MVETVLEEGHGVLGGSEPDDYAEGGHFGQTLENEVFADFVCAWVDGLVDEGWCPPEVGEVLQRDVLRVGAELVELGQWWRGRIWVEICVP